MTLTKSKPPKTTREQQRRHGRHHRHSHGYLKTYWPYLPMAAIVSLGILTTNVLGSVHRSVLGYATDMSIQSLLDDTNAQRTDNSEQSLTLNDLLDQAAQAKANDMAAHDYWSHNTPDGRTPWTFITAAGYQYQAAGENLAYGFDTASDTVTAWMNSPEHRANILNASYQNVGFGIINVADYQQSGPETLVVAMYGTPATPVARAAAAPAAPAQPAPESRPAAVPGRAAPAPTSTPQPAASSAPAPAKPAASNPSPVATVKSDTVRPVASPAEPQPAQVTRWQLVASNVPLSTSALAILCLVAFSFLIVRHGLAWRRVLVRSERFVLRHPLADISAVSLVMFAIILTRTVGLIR